MQPRKPQAKPGDEVSHDASVDGDAFEAEPSRAAKKPKRKERSWDEAGYHPKKDKHKTKKARTLPDVVAMRADKATHFKNDKGEMEEIKISVMIEADTLERFGSPLRKKIARQFQDIPQYRPLDSVTEYSLIGSPLQARTPNKTKMRRIERVGPLHFLTNNPEAISFEPIKIKDAGIDDDFYKSPQYKSIKGVLDEYKNQSEIVTPALLKQSQDERASKKLSRDQAAVMVKKGEKKEHASATAYANATCLFSDTMRWEWLHMIAHMIQGSKSQHDGNLFAGSYDANTLMAMVEKQMSMLAKEYPDGFKLNVYVDLLPGTHIGTNICYTLKLTDELELPFGFNAQTPNMPHITYQDYIRAFLENVIAHSKEKTDQADIPEVPRSPLKHQSQHVFFKKEKREELRESKTDEMDIESEHEKKIK